MSITWRALSVFYLIASSFHLAVFLSYWFNMTDHCWEDIFQKNTTFLSICSKTNNFPQTLKIKTKLVMKNHAILRPCFIFPILINRNISLLRNINDLCYIQYIMKKTKHFDCFLFGGWFGLWCLTPVSTIIR